MNHRNLRLPALLLAALLTAACSDLPTEALRGLEARTDRTAYAVGDTVTFEVSNLSDADAFFYHCDYRISFVLERQTADGWTTAAHYAGPICPAIFATGVKVLPPGSIYGAGFRAEEAGTFRIRLDTGPRSQAIGSVRVVSNTFTVQ